MPLIQADARAIPLADESVNCVVTSPPYWGLRDYGTARWEGGDEGCDHAQEPPRFNGPKQISAQVSGHASKAESHARRECPRCGASRVDAQIGLEATPDEFVATMVQVFREVWRVLRKDGTCWVNLGDSYASSPAGNFGSGTKPGDGGAYRSPKPKMDYVGLKPKDLVGIPWRVALALQMDGWYLRSDIIWHKPNSMPESVTDRPTKAHEYIFLLTKSARYWYDADAVREPWTCDRDDMRGKGVRTGRGYLNQTGVASNHETNDGGGAGPIASGGRNLRSVWTIPTQPYPGAHFATFPEALAERCILAGCPAGGRVLDPFVGSGTVVQVARRHGRIGIGLDLSWTYLHDHAMARGDGRTSEAAVKSLPMFAR